MKSDILGAQSYYHKQLETTILLLYLASCFVCLDAEEPVARVGRAENVPEGA